ncbi:hypothetical protein BVRB_029350, partial [Beta vulgaris subsp. vulgaris]
ESRSRLSRTAMSIAARRRSMVVAVTSDRVPSLNNLRLACLDTAAELGRNDFDDRTAALVVAADFGRCRNAELGRGFMSGAIDRLCSDRFPVPIRRAYLYRIKFCIYKIAGLGYFRRV